MPASEAQIALGLVVEMADEATPATRTYLAEVTDITPPSETTDTVDVTHQQSANRYREFIDGLTDGGDFSFDMNYVAGSASDVYLRASRNKSKWVYITFPSGHQLIFKGKRTGYEISASLGDKQTVTVTFKVSGEPVLTGATAPRSIVAPAVVGTPTVGAPLTLDPGVWAGAMEQTYQWKVDGTAVSGATSSTYVPVTADIGSPVTCTVKGENDDFETSVTSAATADVA
ncbi:MULTISPECIES: phage tail tube protein [Rhizobium/Agrobacterium group]|uniref:Outer capsid protein Hoc n=1 Tax=Allorhizobium ampelinum (strain ATCC BAA-846 / DSM 112012 / S4) TaxID=311402 RepID=B9K2S9_ALLAM|nr:MULTISPECIES: phage tail tube protein [Rhizobium/Agrobacterium group]ACM39177.1 outer capsid protein Hoc [Allorhizobium ampelinum S4]MUO27191.1 histidine kinase [Agrobacterium vitis]MVA47328.1 histidine kinase [Agrobacterium vitis]